MRFFLIALFVLSACSSPADPCDAVCENNTNNTDNTNSNNSNNANNANNQGCSQTENACGGCETLSSEPGESCETCGTVVCESENSVTCDTSGCEVCTPSDEPCDEACSVSFEECVGSELQCNTTFCAATILGEVCSHDDECESSNCANGFCSPLGYVYVPSGTFTMGAPPTEPGFHPDRENGQHEVTLTRAIFVQETTVTQGEWTAMFGANPSYFQNCGPDCPVELINMFEMFRYANELSLSEGLDACYNLVDCLDEYFNEGCPPTTRGGMLCANRVYVCDELAIEPALDCNGYRLATESEWEYFARAGTQTAYITPSGTIADVDDISWNMSNGEVSYETDFNCEKPDARLDCLVYPPDQFYGTHPVAQKLPNNWGLYDITGNIWERTWDVRDTYPDPGSSVTDPTGPEITGNQARAVRGGPFNSSGQYLRVAYRTGPAARSRYYNQGFRLVRTVQ